MSARKCRAEGVRNARRGARYGFTASRRTSRRRRFMITLSYSAHFPSLQPAAEFACRHTVLSHQVGWGAGWGPRRRGAHPAAEHGWGRLSQTVSPRGRGGRAAARRTRQHTRSAILRTRGPSDTARHSCTRTPRRRSGGSRRPPARRLRRRSPRPRTHRSAPRRPTGARRRRRRRSSRRPSRTARRAR